MVQLTKSCVSSSINGTDSTNDVLGKKKYIWKSEHLPSDYENTYYFYERKRITERSGFFWEWQFSNLPIGISCLKELKITQVVDPSNYNLFTLIIDSYAKNVIKLLNMSFHIYLLGLRKTST